MDITQSDRLPLHGSVVHPPHRFGSIPIRSCLKQQGRGVYQLPSQSSVLLIFEVHEGRAVWCRVLVDFSVSMLQDLKIWALLSLLWIATVRAQSTIESSLRINKGKVKSAVFRSPAFVLGPGHVQNKFYFGIDFPKGHIALKGFNAEVIDEAGNSIPLHETYLHHWLVERFYLSKNLTEAMLKPQNKRLHISKYIPVRNDGVCQDRTLDQLFGLGSETRHTSTFIPDPYAIVVGDPNKIPEGYEELWLLNVHAIDTRGVVNSLGCTECRCDLYNKTKDEYDRPLKKDYIGGLFCCPDESQCQLKEGFQAEKRTLYLKYTVYWMDMDESVVPVRTYILDVTDTGERSAVPSRSPYVGCQIEYNVAQCIAGSSSTECIDMREATMIIPKGGDVIYAVAHQHIGGNGSILYGQDGRVICSSLPLYGRGREAGNEAGYIVGMTTCYPEPGTVKIYSGEILKLQSKYNKASNHTGVMSLFYLLVAGPGYNSASNSHRRE